MDLLTERLKGINMRPPYGKIARYQLESTVCHQASGCKAKIGAFSVLRIAHYEHSW